jgi:hypothetical protein
MPGRQSFNDQIATVHRECRMKYEMESHLIHRRFWWIDAQISFPWVKIS